MFNVALQENWISKNPFSCGESLIEIAHERKRERILTISEENKLLFACEQSKNPNLKVIVIALLDTGARCGEMLKCQWKDLDFSTRILTIRGENTKTLKTRQVALTSRLFDNLMALFDNSARNLESRIFGISDNFRTSFKNACKRANIKYGGIDGLCIHSLRHTAATRLIQGQMPIQLVGRVLGHQQPQTTYRYLSANEETLYQAASILESIQKPKIDSSDSELIN
jgi:integrase